MPVLAVRRFVDRTTKLMSEMAAELGPLPRLFMRGSFALWLGYENTRTPNDLDMVSDDEASIPSAQEAIRRVAARHGLLANCLPRSPHPDGRSWYHNTLCNRSGRVVLGIDIDVSTAYGNDCDSAICVAGIRCLAIEILLAEKIVRLTAENPLTPFFGRWPLSHLRVLVGQPLRRWLGPPQRNPFAGDVYDLWWASGREEIDLERIRALINMRQRRDPRTFRDPAQLLSPVQRRLIHLNWRHSLVGRVPMIPTAERAMRAASALGRRVGQ
jgi:hypothetical protein